MRRLIPLYAVNIERYRLVAVLLIFLLNTACSQASTRSKPQLQGQATKELHVFAAASLTGAFEEIVKAFSRDHADIQVVFNFAGSQQLVQQIRAGAPADVFASADKRQMDGLAEEGDFLGSPPQVFARNHLIVVAPADNPGKIRMIRDLAKPGLKLVLAASEVPLGQYSMEFLNRASSNPELGTGFKENVLRNVVSYEENVRAVFNKVALGEADAGIVYKSDLEGESARDVEWIEIPEGLNVSAIYPIAALRESHQQDLAEAFIRFVLSNEGQAILENYGLIPVNR